MARLFLTALMVLATQPAVDAPEPIDQPGSETIETEPEPIESKQIVPAMVQQEQEKPEQIEEPETETYIVTAYTAGPESTGKTPDHPAYGITASGEKVQAGVTVACPPEMEFGTRLHIEGVGERICHDRGGAIKGKRLDVYIPDLQDALEFGRQTLEVAVIE